MSVKVCGICGFVTTSSIRYKINQTKDSKDVCVYCYKSWTKELQKKYKKMTVEEIKTTLDQEGYQYPEFFPSFEVEDFIQFDDRHRLWKELSGGTCNRKTLTAITAMIPMAPMPYDNVVKAELFETGNAKKSKEISVKISYKDEGVLKYYKIVVSDDQKSKKTSSVNEWYHDIATAIIEAFNERINKKEEIPNIRVEQIVQTSPADELLKYKELLDCGLLTEEEFKIQKNKLLQSGSNIKEEITNELNQEIFTENTNSQTNENNREISETLTSSKWDSKNNKETSGLNKTVNLAIKFQKDKFLQNQNNIKEETTNQEVPTENTNSQTDENNIEISEIPTCPKCGSKNIKEISSLNKAVNLAMFNVFAAGKLVHKWHCNDCKKEW